MMILKNSFFKIFLYSHIFGPASASVTLVLKLLGAEKY